MPPARTLAEYPRMGLSPSRIGISLGCLTLMAVALAAASPAFAQSPPPPPTLRDLTATGEGREMYPPFDPGTHHYAVGCGGSGALTLALSATHPDTRVTVNGVRVPGGNAVVELAGLAGDSDVVIESRNSGGGSAAYTVHCLPGDFPTVTARKSPDASDMLILGILGSFLNPSSYIAIFDTNGVPRFHRRISNATTYARYHPDGRYPYSYFQMAGHIPCFRETDCRNYEAYVLDHDLGVVDIVQVIPPLTHTDPHDFIIKPNGNYVLMSYEPARRDFRSFHDPDGNPYSASEITADSVIQEITPEREQVFLWNSWDHMAIEDCMQHRFPWDYAHINSLYTVEGDIIASFRGCAQVLKIDGKSGDIVWLLGKSNRSDADWIGSGSPAPLKIKGDPYGEFCGQHAARLKPDGNLILFDNGVHCPIDPETGASIRTSDVVSRVVEYSLDPETGQAVFQRHHSLHGTFDRLSRSRGNVEMLDNGNWLISWGPSVRGIPPDESITEVNPLTGEELLSIRIIGGSGGLLTTSAYPLPPDALEWRPARHLGGLEPGWNRIVWRGRDGVSVASATEGIGTLSSVWARDAKSRSWLGFFPDSPLPSATNVLSALTVGQRYWIAVEER